METVRYKVLNSRRHPRVDVSYLIKYQKVHQFDGIHVSNIKDISAGGVRFWTDESVMEGELLQMKILLPPLGHVLHVLGKVRRVRGVERSGVYYVGVSFYQMRAEDQQQLEAFVNRLLSPARESGHHQEPDIVKRTGIFK